MCLNRVAGCLGNALYKCFYKTNGQVNSSNSSSSSSSRINIPQTPYNTPYFEPINKPFLSKIERVLSEEIKEKKDIELRHKGTKQPTVLDHMIDKNREVRILINT